MEEEFILETEADVDCDLVLAPKDKQMDDLIFTTPSENKLHIYSNDVDVMTFLSKSEMRILIAMKTAGVYTERTHAEVQIKFEETFDYVLELGNIVA